MWALRCLLIVALVAGLAEVRLSFKEKSKGGENFAVGMGTVTLVSRMGRPAFAFPASSSPDLALPTAFSSTYPIPSVSFVFVELH